MDQIGDFEQLRRLLAEADEMKTAYERGEFSGQNYINFCNWFLSELKSLAAISN